MKPTQRLLPRIRLHAELLEPRDLPSNWLATPLDSAPWLDLNLDLWRPAETAQASGRLRFLLDQLQIAASGVAHPAVARSEVGASTRAAATVSDPPAAHAAADAATLLGAASVATPAPEPRLESITVTTTEDGLAHPQPGFRMQTFAGTDAGPAGPGRILYGSYLGGPGVDETRAVADDGRGHLFVTGTFDTGDPDQDMDVFVAKIHQGSGQAVWLTTFGGVGRDDGNGIDADHLGNVYVSGTFTNDQSGETNAFVLRLNRDGTQVIWRRNIGGPKQYPEAGAGILRYSASTNMVYYTGYLGVNLAGTRIRAGGFGRLRASDGERAPYALAGVYFTPPNEGDLITHDVAMDSSGGVYMAGQHTVNRTGDVSAVVFRMRTDTPSPNDWVRDFPMEGVNAAQGIALDAVRNSYVVGYYTAPDGTIGLEYHKLDPRGNPIYRLRSPVVDDSFFTVGRAVALDVLGRPYVAGSFYTAQNDADAFLTRITPRQVGMGFEFDLDTVTFGGTGDDHVLALAGQFNPSALRYAAVVGTTNSASDFPLTENALQPEYGGGDSDGFVTRVRLPGA